MNDFDINILIVEENRTFSMELQNLLEELSYRITQRVDNYKVALNEIHSKSPDLIFIDIAIYDSQIGNDVVQKIYQLNIPILFISYSRQVKADDNINEIKREGYLVKPIEKLSLKSAIQSAIAKTQSAADELVGTSLTNNVITQDRFYFKDKDIFKKVPLHNIAFVKSDDNYCTVWTIEGKSFSSRITISNLEQLFPSTKFIRTHRQYLVQLDAIDTIDLRDSTCKVIGRQIPVSRSKKKALESVFNIIR